MRMTNSKKLIFTWEDFWQYCEVITQTIRQSDKSYSQIVAIARGGFYLGDYLSRRLQIPLAVIVANSYTKPNQQNELSISDISSVQPLQGDVLLVDDLLDTGITMVTIKNKLEQEDHLRIDTAVIWQKSQCQYQANYYYSVTPQDYWIVQPFEVSA